VRAEYIIEAGVTALADDDPAGAVFAALAYCYPLLGARSLGDPHPHIDLAAGCIVDSRRVAGRVFEVCLRLRARADEEVTEERVRRAVLEKLEESLDSRANGQITEFVATDVVVESMLPAGRDE
jgi:hypothetical protein